MKDYYLFTDFETTGLNITSSSLPIEMGVILTDDEYNILETEEIYINPFPIEKTGGWEGEELDAYKVHNISLSIILTNGSDPTEVVKILERMLDRYRLGNGQNVRFIIMSDNGQFEYNAMKKLFELAGESNFPFHHAAWDVNILVNSVQKVLRGKGSHKAIQDAFRTYKTVIRALERNGFRKWDR